MRRGFEGRVLLDEGRYEEAVAVFDEIIAVDQAALPGLGPSCDAGVFGELAYDQRRALFRMRRYAEAAEAWTEAARHAPNDATYGLKRTLALARDVPGALASPAPKATGPSCEPVGMGSITWGRDVAEVYDVTSAAMFEPQVLDPAVDLLVELARGGPALEPAVGTGRIALPVSARGVAVHGIELSPHMADQLRRKPGAERVAVTIGDMTTTRVPGSFTLVYLVWNAIMNVTTQQEQVAVFANAAAHLEPGGCFVVEVVVPQLRRVVPGEAGRVFTLTADHVGIETFDDLVGQVSWSHHWMAVDGGLVRHSAPYRYVWPSELDLMGQIAGFRLRERWAGWTREPFTADSTNQVAVFERLP